jgi:ribosomal protein S12 methylthiotransferase
MAAEKPLARERRARPTELERIKARRTGTRARGARAPKVGFVSLGCPKALVDSERILTQLRAEGYEVAPTYDAADLVVVNTCGFIDAAVDESLDAIGEALEENGRVIVTGCLGAKPERILERHPQVLKVTGPQAYEAVVGAVHEHLPPRHDPFLDLVPPQGVRLTPRHYAYLKIAEGCNNRCSFCIIPAMRGRLASRPIDAVLREAERLARAGVKELLVISQDTSAYGADLHYAPGEWRGVNYATRFIDLARALGELGIWIRLHYVYPYPHVDKVIPLMAEERVLPYLDIPFQHGSPTVLKRMRRPAHAENTLARIRDWRAAAISARRLAARVGQRVRVLVDTVTDGIAHARSAAEAPEIDGVIRIAAAGSGARAGRSRLRSGEFADVEIVSADSYDLTGRLAE